MGHCCHKRGGAVLIGKNERHSNAAPVASPPCCDTATTGAFRRFDIAAKSLSCMGDEHENAVRTS
ncbi:hypothetical protein PAMC26510_28425 [Caballeronia sordidicola]|uniref:Uncharacterized protein n=1 Tax=Caballeronia sordidicola TaxID=196367 RepID=A0A242MKP6_CABSO|nr:hypothetical protein PAMC26510_28425 [Caballeronia sordidicola]OTP71878.1 hypothetical protein PAMC26577_23235 [Caballeronia sordidicola]